MGARQREEDGPFSWKQTYQNTNYMWLLPVIWENAELRTQSVLISHTLPRLVLQSGSVVGSRSTDRRNTSDRMLTQKVFIRKTKRGNILKIVREHYLREDIGCGSVACRKCDSENEKPLQKDFASASEVVQQAHYVVPDTNVVLHQVCHHAVELVTDVVRKTDIVLSTRMNALTLDV